MKTIILAGGKGTRLWPISKSYYSKQFIKFKELNNQSLFQITFLRALEINIIKDIIILVTNKQQKDIVIEELKKLNINFPEKNIQLVPDKDTFSAITYSMQSLEGDILILPSDHVIKNEIDFFKTLDKAKELAKTSLVIFGIKPTSPHTGYGYIKYNKNKVKKFKEKPNLQTAKKYVKDGYLWNSGIFYFNKEIYNKELEKINKELYSLFTKGTQKEIFKNAPKISVDYGILEKSNNISVIPVDIEWLDLGNFDAICKLNKKDKNQNQADENTIFQNSKNNLIHNETNKKIALIDVEDLIIIETSKTLIICKKNSSEKIKNIYNLIGKNK